MQGSSHRPHALWLAVNSVWSLSFSLILSLCGTCVINQPLQCVKWTPHVQVFNRRSKCGTQNKRRKHVQQIIDVSVSHLMLPFKTHTMISLLITNHHSTSQIIVVTCKLQFLNPINVWCMKFWFYTNDLVLYICWKLLDKISVGNLPPLSEVCGDWHTVNYMYTFHTLAQHDRDQQRNSLSPLDDVLLSVKHSETLSSVVSPDTKLMSYQVEDMNGLFHLQRCCQTEQYFSVTVFIPDPHAPLI